MFRDDIGYYDLDWKEDEEDEEDEEVSCKLKSGLGDTERFITFPHPQAF